MKTDFAPFLDEYFCWKVSLNEKELRLLGSVIKHVHSVLHGHRNVAADPSIFSLAGRKGLKTRRGLFGPSPVNAGFKRVRSKWESRFTGKHEHIPCQTH